MRRGQDYGAALGALILIMVASFTGTLLAVSFFRAALWALS